MKILVNVFHPDLEASKVNASWIEKIKHSDDVTLNLQYTNYPNWQFDIQREQQLLTDHQLVVFQFPFLWYSVPPLMKKWMDDVLSYGWAYGADGNALKGKQALVATSTGCSAASYQAGNENNYSMSEFLKPVQQTFELVQMHYLSPYILHGAADVCPNVLAKSADSYFARLLNQ